MKKLISLVCTAALTLTTHAQDKTAPEQFTKTLKNAPDAFKVDQYDEDLDYKITGKFGPYFQIVQVLEDGLIIADDRIDKYEIIAVLVPEDASKLKTLNMPSLAAGDNPRMAAGTTTGVFLGFQQIEFYTGAKRLPIFVVPGLQMMSDKFFDLSKDQ